MLKNVSALMHMLSQKVETYDFRFIDHLQSGMVYNFGRVSCLSLCLSVYVCMYVPVFVRR